MNNLLDTARRAYKAGLTVVPPREDGTKRPISSWKQYQEKRPSGSQMEAWYGSDSAISGIGIVTGRDLELFEFDHPETYRTFVDTAESLGLDGLISRIGFGYEERSPGGGVHWFYRCDEIGPNTTLARRVGDDGTTQMLIQTRGNGGYAVIAPSNGKVHPSGKPYVLTSGGVETIVTITGDERATLWELARAFDAMPRQEFTGSAETNAAPRDGEVRPGDDFNARGPSWEAILEPHGWVAVKRQGEMILWRRPGKDRGVSASTNWGGHGLFYPFTSSTAFDPERGYSKWRTWAILNHPGDWSGAAKALAADGYGGGSFVPPGPKLRLGKRDAQDADPEEIDELAGVTIDDFRAYMDEHKYICIPTRTLWPGASINARLGKGAALWLDKNRPIEQMIWAPGQPEIIDGRLLDNGGWREMPGWHAFNLYQPPTLVHGDAGKAGPWTDHVALVYPDDAAHIIAWLAQRVQSPQIKINHALVFGGMQGIGKDTILEPVKYAIGPWNFNEVSPIQLLGRFNGYVKSVILRVSEARDLGDVDRYKFYEHLKQYTAAPPDVLRVDEKHRQEYGAQNVCGPIITTNHKTDGIYLPADDRRHYVAWSDAIVDDFDGDYWTDLYRWYECGGYGHVAAYLAAFDLSAFNPKAPPPKTEAFWAIVDASRAPEDGEMADAIDALGSPDALTLEMIWSIATGSFADWIHDRKNARQVPHRMEAAGYVPVRNDTAKSDGRWKIGGKRQTVYARRDLSVHDRIVAARGL